jgi:hypothetical protein
VVDLVREGKSGEIAKKGKSARFFGSERGDSRKVN